MMLSNHAINILKKRYFLKDESGNCIEDWDGLCRRVSSIIDVDTYFSNNLDKLYELCGNKEDMYNLLKECIFLPNTPTLMNAGKSEGQLSACFVLPIEDSMESIFSTLKTTALIHKSGGGTGFSFNRLRPKDSKVRSTGGVSSGPVSFLKVYNAATEAIKQGGARRGANMGVLRCDHPDILEFITCKQDNKDITNFNLSVGITKKFMDALENGGVDYELQHASLQEKKTLNSQLVWDLLIDSAYKNGEPGILFLDTINKFNSTPELGAIESTNPCGEQPLLPEESCNLGSINLGVIWDKGFDYLRWVVRCAVRFLDNVITVNTCPTLEIKEATLKTRKIGLGVMGFADYLIKTGVPYNSPKALEIASTIMYIIQDEAFIVSKELGKMRGYPPYFSMYKTDRDSRRNACVTTIAPTGTLSQIAGCSSGIEPLFGLVETRSQADSTETIINPLFLAALDCLSIPKDLIPGILDEVAKTGSCQLIDRIPESIKQKFVTAHDIDPIHHVKMQAEFQKCTCSAVSKTINLPHNATRDIIDKVFKTAYNLNCKGVTIYRDGSRQNQTIKTTSNSNGNVISDLSVSQVPKTRGKTLPGSTTVENIGCGKLYITVNSDEGGPFEVFTHTGKLGGCPSQSEATSRLISLVLRSGLPVEQVVKQLKGIRCPSCIRKEGILALSCPDAIGKVLEQAYVEDLNSLDMDTFFTLLEAQTCPECRLVLKSEGGCIICRNCGYSKCG